MVLFKSYKQLHLTFSTSCVTCLKIISWITWTMQVQRNQDMSDKRMPGETQEMWQAVWGGKVRGWNTMQGAAWWQAWKSLDKYFCQGKHFTVHYTVKRKVCAGLKPIWLVQVWRQRDLESIVLDLRVRTYPPISAFTQDWNQPTLFFNITSSGSYPWSILTDQSSLIVLCHCYADRDDIKKVREIWPTNLLWHFHRRRHKTTRQATHRIIIVTDAYTRSIMSCRDRKRIHLDTCWRQVKGIRSPPRHSSRGCDSSGVCDLYHPSPPRRRRTSAAARPPRRGPTLPPIAAAFGLGGAATRLAPRGQGVSERELLENSQSHRSQSNTNIARHLTKECQEKHKERRELLPMKKLWLGVGKDCVPVSSETLFQVVADAGWLKNDNITQKQEPIMAQM